MVARGERESKGREGKGDRAEGKGWTKGGNGGRSQETRERRE